MKKFLKFTGITIVSIILIYVLFIVEESIRLSNNAVAKPLIVFEEYKTREITIYKSIGFTLKNDECNKGLCGGQEFWLFDKFLIWGWIS